MQPPPSPDTRPPLPSPTLSDDPFSNSARLATEIELLSAAYPTDLTFNPATRSLKFSATTSTTTTTTPSSKPSSTLDLLIPHDYPSTSLPTILSAIAGDAHGNVDLSGAMTATLHALEPGEEVLDVLINDFLNLLSNLPPPTPAPTTSSTTTFTTSHPHPHPPPPSSPTKTLTILIWTHHLLATSKRKQALAPPPAHPSIRGVTKPGYPGVMVFSGPFEEVKAHVEGLKNQNWAAFQVRLEVVEEGIEGGGGSASAGGGRGGAGGKGGGKGEKGGGGRGGHGEGEGKGEGKVLGWFEGVEGGWEGVNEVETMGEVVKAVGEGKKADFLAAMRIK